MIGRVAIGAGRRDAIVDVGTSLAAPELLSSAADQTVNSIVSGSVNPGSGALVIVVVQTREPSATTHTAPTTTLSNMHDFGSGVVFALAEELDQGGNPYVHTSVWYGYAEGATGAGTITAAFSGGGGPINFAAISVIRFASGWDATPIGETDDSTDATAGSADITFGTPPGSTNYILLTMLEPDADADGTVPSGFIELVDSNNGGSMHYMIAAKADEDDGPHSFTNLGSPSYRSLVGVEIEAAS